MTVPHNVGVLGGGRMGAGIAHAFLLNGAHVTVVERDAEAAASAQERVTRSVEKSVARGDIKEAATFLTRLRISTEKEDFALCNLVVEAVPESWDLKVSALRGVEKHLEPEAVLASNTSSFSVTGLAEVLERPDRFLGLHFFNPVPASNLIEVVIGKQTNPSPRGRSKAMDFRFEQNPSCG